ncbi:response regulator transcription factor [Paenibacillus radicis (ex Gao et al. 2016)]|uniref:Transcriptional regulatory protein YxjL n=1 Tax=Paenibacillus radicis (ex Gao et al. 2016) TaxID=1737354 RepID=A0A917GRI3_9BACL|nr:response regulator transcription factor [Paenibacillus radicis (ex Gao et al. 2016)]GGG54299.1 putative transcriptional regulatory protein YxjL [Paenibacillus radicis (ex Gao et al. 2016)]
MSDAAIRVIVADDQQLVRHGLRYIINAQDDMELAGEAESGAEALQLAAQVCPDVVLMDVRMPGGNGIEATREIMQLQPDCKVVILTTFDQEDYVYEGIRAGAVGYLLKDTAPDELVQAVRAAYRGEAIYRTAIAAKVIGRAIRSKSGDEFELDVTGSRNASAAVFEPLTERESEVLQQMAYGLRNEEIASALYIGESTVKTHVHRILQKLGAEDRTQAVVFAIRNRLVK